MEFIEFHNQSTLLRILNREVRLVPRDGVEPPTPAFSGLRSTT